MQHKFSRAAEDAAARWQSEIGNKETPKDIPAVPLIAALLTDGRIAAFRLLTALKLCPSNAEAKRLIQGLGAKIGPDKTRIESPDQQIEVHTGLIVWAYRTKVCRVEIT